MRRHFTINLNPWTLKLNSTDLIIVLKEGEVVEQGTHDELMRSRGLYHSMWQQQASLEGMEENEEEA